MSLRDNEIWATHDGVTKLHKKGMFDQKPVPLVFFGRLNAKGEANRVGGKIKKYKNQYHIVKEEYGAGEDGSTEVALRYKNDTPGQEKADIPYKKVIAVIKKTLKGKYSRKRSLL